ncbi:hypothetical protein ACFLU8_01775 [Chloroflexota bacterium]
MSTMEAFEEISKTRPKAASFWQNRLKKVLVSDAVNIINKIPDEIMSKISKEFALRVLELNRDKIIKINPLTNGGKV